MRTLFRFLIAIIKLPLKLIWRLKKLLLLVGAGAGAYKGYKASQDDRSA